MTVRDDRGQLAGGEAIPFGLLIFVIGSLLIVNAWAVVDAKFAIDAGAREAARTFSETAPGTSLEDAVDQAERAGLDAVEAHGRNPSRVEFSISGDVEGDGIDLVARCAEVTFTAHYSVPAISLPFIGGYGDGFDVTASHTRTVDPLRSGLTGEATCL